MLVVLISLMFWSSLHTLLVAGWLKKKPKRFASQLELVTPTRMEYLWWSKACMKSHARTSLHTFDCCSSNSSWTLYLIRLFIRIISANLIITVTLSHKTLVKTCHLERDTLYKERKSLVKALWICTACTECRWPYITIIISNIIISTCSWIWTLRF